MVIGLTGKNAAGKGEVANFLKARGFHYFSLSDEVRKEARRRRERPSRNTLVEVGNRLRALYGPGVLADRILARLEPDKNYVIDSIRHPAEVETLRRRKDFVLLQVNAPHTLRFQRLLKRGREQDPKTLKTFLALERGEARSPRASDQQLSRTLKMADRTISNDGSLNLLHRKLQKLLVSLSKKKSRPGWDDYFLQIAGVAALRSNCIKRKVASVIVKDRRIISTGYNGTPRGVRNCNEGGCPRCLGFGISGQKLDECLCSHAEENAITQAAYHGVTIQGSSLYTTFCPCLICTKMIINTGIGEVIYRHGYSLDRVSLRLLREARVKVRQFNSA